MKDNNMDQRQDKQLRGVSLEAVLKKRRLDQALNAKEFAVCAGISYTTARSLFHLASFPVVHGLVFWTDFVEWRRAYHGTAEPRSDAWPTIEANSAMDLPPRAARILDESLVPK